MPDVVRAKLAEALRGHQRNPYGQHDGWWECSCSADEPHTPEHLADVLLSLEGVAIVALPTLMVDRSNVAESIKDRPMWQVEDAWTCLELADCIEYEAAGQTECGTLTVTEARALAAALLAAADAAEAEHHV